VVAFTRNVLFFFQEISKVIYTDTPPNSTNRGTGKWRAHKALWDCEICFPRGYIYIVLLTLFQDFVKISIHNIGRKHRVYLIYISLLCNKQKVFLSSWTPHQLDKSLGYKGIVLVLCDALLNFFTIYKVPDCAMLFYEHLTLGMRS
jgi:hypothetical protein